MRNLPTPTLGAGFSFGSAMRGVGPGFCGKDPHSGSLMSHRRGWNSQSAGVPGIDLRHRCLTYTVAKVTHMHFGPENT